MLNLYFNRYQRNNFNYAIAKDTEFEFIKRKYQSDIQRLIKYYGNSSKIVRNDFILNKLVKALNPGITLDNFSYYHNVVKEELYISRQLGLYNEFSPGKAFYNHFYVNNSIEYIIVADNYTYNGEELTLDILKRSSVRVITTNEKYLDYHLLNRTISKDNKYFTITVIEIDIKLLLMQYKAWCVERLRLDSSTDSNTFVATIILPNAIRSMQDLIIYNRFKTIVTEEDYINRNIRINHPLLITDYSKKIDNVLFRIHKQIKNKKMNIEQYYLTIPTLYNKSLLNSLSFTNYYTTQQFMYIYFISRIKEVYFLLKHINNSKNKSMNKVILGNVKFTLRRYENTGIYNKIPKEVKDYYLELVKDVREMVE